MSPMSILTQSNTLTVGGLFSGIGGFELGLQRAGMQIEWMVENNSFCQRVLAKHWPDVRRYEDVRDCGKHNLKSVDLICGGFPCQPHSTAGKRRGAKDDRNLWPEYRRVIAELRPHWVLAENVLGIRTTMLDEVLSDLGGLAYTAGTLIVPACAFDAPHKRERVFIVAYAEEQRAGDERKNIGQTSGEVNTFNDASRFSRGVDQSGDGADVADSQSQLCNGGDDNGGCRPEPPSESGNRVEETRSLSSWWATEPDMGRVAHGVPHRVDRLRALGNAIVPQVVEWLGRQILIVGSKRS